MVYLNKIYTRQGDAGTTSLGTGERVPKTDLRIVAYGSTDELNAVLGLCLTAKLSEPWMERLKEIQNDLFDLSADLCIPETDEPPEFVPLRVTESQVKRLEEWIDEINENLEPLTSFILPGGSTASTWLHLARTVCRRAEIEVSHLAQRDQINMQVLAYLNRLSDLLFVLGRKENDNGKADVLWKPGANTSSEKGA